MNEGGRDARICGMDDLSRPACPQASPVVVVPRPQIPLTLRDAGKSLSEAATVQVTLHSGVKARVDLLTFEVGLFETDAFRASGIACPPSIVRSVTKRQAEFFFGRLAAHASLQRLGLPAGTDTRAIGIGPSREPLWPPGAVGSITHGHGRAAALALGAHDVRGAGIDLETKVSASARAALLELAIDAQECAVLGQSALAGESFDMALTLAFSAKESLFKGAFGSVGRYFDFAAAKVSGIDMASGRLTLTLQEHLSADFRLGQRCDVHFTFIDPQTVLTCFSWGIAPAHLRVA